MSPDRHRENPISIRPPGDLRKRLYAYAEREGRPVRAVIIQAITELLDREEVTDDRQ